MGNKVIRFDDPQSEISYHPWQAYCQSKLADLLFTLELGRLYPLLSNAAHPGYAPTNLQTSGPGRAQNFSEKILAWIASQDAASGALPTLRAATERDTPQGACFGPGGLFGLKGNPKKLTGASWPVNERMKETKV